MKKTLTTTIMALLLCVCLVFGLAGCGASQDDIDTTVTNAIAPVSEQITAINGSIDELKAADTELNGYIGALETAVAKLETDLAATNAKITELEESLDGAEYATVTQLTETKTALEGQIATANTAIDTLKAADTTQNSKISALETAKASLESEITAIENRLTIVLGNVPSTTTDSTARPMPCGKAGFSTGSAKRRTSSWNVTTTSLKSRRWRKS